MEENYGIWSTGECYSPMVLAPSDYPSPAYVAGFGLEEEAELISESAASCVAVAEREEDAETILQSKIKRHPQYPFLIQAFVDCQKVGASSEAVSILNGVLRDHQNEEAGGGVPLGADPELDEFMDKYTEILVKYKKDLERPFNEASAFLQETERQLSSLSNRHPPPAPALPCLPSDDGAASSDEERCGEDMDMQEARQRGAEDRDLKDRLLQRFGSHIGTLKMEFSKKRKKGKLPEEARQALLEWWNVHNKWPYPTEADKISLAESTGLDQKQINNWFINQRKRHWNSSENIQFALTDDCPGQFRAID
ncbi:hypothetical protein MLD38_037885 [Melastoma candidum]|uniref:Uncharacterized protein n=1 Tax=Melastoma candidum TaxID=119954 RepID=A0ACB9KZK2_9MYRT|nr:hypothetical protein MLD38_037885 [Melastoma candidum]